VDDKVCLLAVNQQLLVLCFANGGMCLFETCQSDFVVLACFECEMNYCAELKAGLENCVK